MITDEIKYVVAYAFHKAGRRQEDASVGILCGEAYDTAKEAADAMAAMMDADVKRHVEALGRGVETTASPVSKTFHGTWNQPIGGFTETYEGETRYAIRTIAIRKAL